MDFYIAFNQIFYYLDKGSAVAFYIVLNLHSLRHYSGVVVAQIAWKYDDIAFLAIGNTDAAFYYFTDTGCVYIDSAVAFDYFGVSRNNLIPASSAASFIERAILSMVQFPLLPQW